MGKGSYRTSVKRIYDIYYALRLPPDVQIELQRRTADFQNFFCLSEIDTRDVQKLSVVVVQVVESGGGNGGESCATVQGLGNSLYLFLASYLRDNFLLILFALEAVWDSGFYGMYGCCYPHRGSWGLRLLESGDCTLFIVLGWTLIEWGLDDAVTYSLPALSGRGIFGYTLPNPILPFKECSTLSFEFWTPSV